MISFIVRRLAQSVLVILGVSVLSFGIMFLSGDPTMLMVGEDWSVKQVEEFRHIMGFDRPWYVQYGDFISKAVQGDFGVSLRHKQPTFGLVMSRMPATLELTFAAMFLSIILAFPIGILSAVKKDSTLDALSMGGALLGQSVPVFWLGIMLILIFSAKLQWTPVAGRGTWSHLVLPSITLGAFFIARNARMVRSCMLDVLGMEYVTTARSKGLREFVVIYKHALRNALIPVVTLIGLQFGALLGGAVITETIFAWPGVGRLVIQAIQGKDFPLVQAAVTVLALSFVLINLLVDYLYCVLDPRVRMTGYKA
jgi:peptide/nickel transport system permease protein